MIRPCNRCETEYETESFASGPKYCTAACRNNLHEHAGKRILNGERGQPNKYGRPEWWMKQSVIGYFEGAGWRVHRVHCPGEKGERADTYHDKKSRYRIKLTKSWFAVRVCICGWWRNELWADVVAYYKDGSLRFASACKKRRIIGKRGGIPCERDTCKKCSKLHLLTQLVNKKTAPYALATAKRQEPRI